MSSSEAAQEAVKENNVNTDSIKCASCGANMIFDPESQMLICESCGRKEAFNKDNAVEEIDIQKAFDSAETWSNETNVFRCENCGAVVAMEKGVIAQKCPFCETSHVIQANELSGLKPNVVLPFEIGKDKVGSCFKKWSKSKLLAPRAFKKDVSIDRFNGVYAPCFTFDSNTFSRYAGRIGKTKTRTVHTKDGTRTETYVQWRNVSGDYAHFFDDISVNAFDKLGQRNMEKLMPFDNKSACKYESKFISGFMAARYSKEIKECWEDAKNMIDAQIKRLILAMYDCDQVSYLNVSTTHNNVTYKYVLLPIYLANYAFKKKTYNIFINGSTGKVVGKSPVSPLRATLLGIFIAALCVGLYFLISYLNG